MMRRLLRLFGRASPNRTEGSKAFVAGPLEEGKTVAVRPASSADEQPAHLSRQPIGRSTASKRLAWAERDQYRITRRGEQNSARTSEAGRDDPTRLVSYSLASAPSPSNSEEEARTRLVDTGSLGHDDPVAGWLVVIEGPGRGQSLEVGLGANSLGRAPGQKLCLDFGDTQISRERHAVLTYDPRSRRFILQNGEGRALTYVDDNLVIEPVDLKGGETITVGATQLRFVAFCGPEFGWS